MSNKTRADISEQELMQALAGYVTTGEAADLMGMWNKSVRNLIKFGKLKALKVGRDWLIARSSIAEYQKNKSAKGRPTRVRVKRKN